jgi:hypothetical protein
MTSFIATNRLVISIQSILNTEYVLFGKYLLDFFLHGFSGLLAIHFLGINSVLQVDFLRDHVSGGEDVSVVHVFDESLDLRPAFNLFSTHSFCHFQGIPFNSSYKSVRKFLVLNKRIIQSSVLPSFHHRIA